MITCNQPFSFPDISVAEGGERHFCHWSSIFDASPLPFPSRPSVRPSVRLEYLIRSKDEDPQFYSLSLPANLSSSFLPSILRREYSGRKFVIALAYYTPAPARSSEAQDISRPKSRQETRNCSSPLRLPLPRLLVYSCPQTLKSSKSHPP